MLRPRDQELPRWLWLWVPLCTFALLLLAVLRDDSDPTYIRRWWFIYLMPGDEQTGVIELSTPIFSALAVLAGIAALRHRARLPTRWLRAWVAFLTLACIFFTGEETAWGQNQLGFAPPTWWPHAVTNLHSLGDSQLKQLWPGLEFDLTAWFDDIPKLLLELFALGGIIRVFLQRKKSWFWPTCTCVPAAVVAILARLPERLDWIGLGYTHMLFDHNLVLLAKSLQELYFAMFLFIYLLAIWYRLAGTDHASTITSGSKQLEPSP